MKIKTSVTLEQSLLEEIDSLSNNVNRSKVVEEALVLYFKTRKKKEAEQKDIAIINDHEENLNSEALDVLSYQKKI